MEKGKNIRSTAAGLVFVGLTLIGLGLGLFFHQVVVGLFLGLGGGFVGMGITWALVKQK